MLKHFPTVSLFSFFILVVVFCGSHQAFSMHAGEEHDDKDPAGELRIKPPAQGDVTDMARVPDGNFKRGSTFEENKIHLKICRKVDKACRLWWFDDEYPAKQVFVDTFWMDVYEVTNSQYLEFVLATGHRPALDEACTTDACREGNLWKGKSFPKRIARQPVTQVNWYDADAYCRFRGKRLPTEAEWEKAARGPNGRQYPWGNASPKGRATYQKKWLGAFTMTPVGTYPHGVSMYGVHDMAGNVWEWVDDWYHRNYYARGSKIEPKGPASGDFKVVRGGSWVNYADTLRSALRRWSRPQVQFNDTGFRCAMDANEKKH